MSRNYTNVLLFSLLCLFIRCEMMEFAGGRHKESSYSNLIIKQHTVPVTGWVDRNSSCSTMMWASDYYFPSETWSVNLLFLITRHKQADPHFTSCHKNNANTEREGEKKERKKKRTLRFLRAPVQTSAAVSCALKSVQRERELLAAAKTLSPRLFISAGVEWISRLRGFVNAECSKHRKTHTQNGAAGDFCG